MTTLARSGQFIEPDQADLACPDHVKKIFRFPFQPKSPLYSRRLIPHEGAYRDRHERWDEMRWTRQRRRARGSQGKVT
jgi:hypothetical protein